METEDIHKLFYLSLYDPVSWESEDIDFLPRERNIRSVITSILSKYSGKHEFFKNYWSSKPEERKDFIRKVFYTGHVANLIICYGLKQNKIYAETKQNDRIDIKIKAKGECKNIGCVELKRLFSTKNIEGEINNIEQSFLSCDSRTKKCRHIGLFIFPVLPDEDKDRVRELVDGYQRITKYLIRDERKRYSIFSMVVDVQGMSYHGTALDQISKIIKNFMLERKDGYEHK